MGLLDFLGAASVPAMQGAAGYQAGQERGRQENLQNTMQMFQMLRQNQLDDQQRQVQQAYIGNLNSEAAMRGNIPAWKPFEGGDPANPGQNIWFERNERTGQTRRMQLPGDDTETGASDAGATATPPPTPPPGPLSPASLFRPFAAAQPAQRAPQGGGPILGKATAPLPGTPEYDRWQANKPMTPFERESLAQQGAGTVLPGADGKPAQLVFTSGRRAGQTIAVPDVLKSVGGAGNAQTAPQLAAAKANLETAMQVIDDYDAKRTAGLANYTSTEATKGAMSSAPAAMTTPKGLFGPLESFAANKAGQNLNANNPDLAAFLTAKKFVAEAILNTHKRPNQTQYEIEQELSAPGVDASPFQIQLGKTRRQKMYQEVFGGAAAPSGPAPSPPPTGLTDAQVAEAVGKVGTDAAAVRAYWAGKKP